MGKYSSCGTCKFFRFRKFAWYCKFHERVIKKLVGCKEHIDTNFKKGLVR